ncbi:polysaccharide lyase family 8 super-sandwich domain-containing protein [Paenibacillus sp. FSL W8-0194]|uniref:polysaccharide lyase family 8 super-sandwich domain-containing protein n=1 Tax=Paenibacillus sp. FSL W8-0194 TaxID=2921711 RepID=UPI0030D7F77B
MGKRLLLCIQSALLIWGLWCVPAPAAAAEPQAADEFGLLRSKWSVYLIGSGYDPNDPNIAKAVASIDAKVTNASGTGFWDTMQKETGRTYLWSDLKGSADAVDAASAYNRLRDMTIAWATAGSSHYRNEALKNDIIGGLDWLYANRYNESKRETGNWWEWEIGIPQSLGDMMVLLHDQLSPAQIANYTKAIDRFCPDPTKRTNSPTLAETGANRLDKALAVVLRGINTENGDKIKEGRDAVGQVLPYVTKGDGFYEDGSFVFHNNIAYTGSYGGVLIGDMAKLLTLLDGSSWPVTDPNLGNMYRWVTDSYEPLIYRGRMMDMVYGRAISRSGESKRGWLIPVLRLSEFAPPELSSSFKSMVKAGIESDPSLQNPYDGLRLADITLLQNLLSDPSVPAREDLVLHKQFSAMDRVVHFRPGYAFGLSMTSTRIANYENGIGGKENPRGWYTGEGMTYLYNRDMPYLDAFWPTVNAYRLPGTTSDGATRAAGKTSTKDWVGGSSLDGLYGAAGMDLDPDNSTLSGRKSWFMFDDEIVALGAGLTSTDNRRVETVVENRMLNGSGDNELIVNGEAKPSQIGWSESMSGVRWAHLNGKEDETGIGYYFPQAATVEGLRESRTGAWRDIHPDGSPDPVTRNYLSLAVHHGTNPANQSYEYVLLPGKNAEDTAAYSSHPDMMTLSNTAEVQAVKEASLGITAANFWSPGTVGFIRARNPASVMAKAQGGELAVAVSDPTQKQAKVRVDLGFAALQEIAKDPAVTVLRTSPTIQIEVNTAGSKGKSHTVRWKIDPSAEPGDLEDPQPDESAKQRIDVQEDAYVRNGAYAGQNFGASNWLDIRNGSSGYARKALLKFDLGSYEHEPYAVKLNVFGATSDSNGTVSTIGVFEVNDDAWHENSLTWNNIPAIGRQLDTVTFAGEQQWRTFDVTEYVRSQLKGDKTVSLALQQVNSDLYATVRSKENENGAYAPYLEIVSMDATPPVTTVHLNGSTEPSAFYKEPVKLEFTAEDQPGGWGVKRTEVRMGDGEWSTVSRSVYAESEGAYTIEYRSIDKAGNTEPKKSVSFTIDQTAPDIQATVTETVYRTDAFHAAIEATDTLSGLGSVTVKLDGMAMGQEIALEPYDLSFGDHWIEVKAVDAAGNEAVRHYRFLVTTDLRHLQEAIQLGSEKGWIHHQGIANSLLVKINRIVNTEDGKTTLNALNALENEVRALSGKKIDDTFAQALLVDIVYLKSLYAES